MNKDYYVYMLTNKSNHVLYTGITNNLIRRIAEHESGTASSFTKRYNATKLVYYEYTHDVQVVIQREKQIKGWIRKKKNQLIEKLNPNWSALNEEILR